MEHKYPEQEALPVPGAYGLVIRKVTGEILEKHGGVRLHEGNNHYYLYGGFIVESYPAECVMEVLTEKEEAV